MPAQLRPAPPTATEKTGWRVERAPAAIPIYQPSNPCSSGHRHVIGAAYRFLPFNGAGKSFFQRDARLETQQPLRLAHIGNAPADILIVLAADFLVGHKL